MTYTVYVIPTRGGQRVQVGSYEAADGQAAIALGEQTLAKLGTILPENASWWAEWTTVSFGELAYPKANLET